MNKKLTRSVRRRGRPANQRVDQLRKLLARGQYDFFLVSGLANICYLTGFTGSNAYVLITPETVVLYTDGRYEVQARQQTEAVDVRIFKNGFFRGVVDDLKNRRIRRLAFEKSRTSFQIYEFLKDELGGRRLQPLDGAVEELRKIKSPEEIEKIQRAVALNSEVFEYVCRRARPTWTEMRFAAEIEYRMRILGADQEAFDTIVASGGHSALPHARPRRCRLQPHSLVVVDQGVILDGYTSDMTRMICFGRPSTQCKELVRAVREARSAAVDAVKAGVKASTVDAKARQVLRRFKLDKVFPHSTGHGLGLEIHEAPRIGPKEDARLTSGMVITIEPGAYVEGTGGARIEDVVVVTPAGCNVLTKTSRALRVL